MNNSKQSRIDIKNNKIIIKHKKNYFDFASLTKILSKIKYVLEIKNYQRNKIIFDFDPFKFLDKLSYVMLECLIFNLIKQHNMKLILRMEPQTNCIFTGGSEYSLLNSLAKGKISNQEFVMKFEKETSIMEKKYRRIIKAEEKKESTIFCILMSDVKTILKKYCDNSSYISEIAEVITELASNAWEHSNSDCLIDLDICDNFTKKSNVSDLKYYGINIVIMNLSETLLGDNLKKKLLEYKLTANNTRYKKVLEAYYNHTRHFTSEYNEDHFFSIASFQNKVSGRIENRSLGGTGLPRLIRSLEKQADTHFCYVASGKNGIKLDMEYLDNNKENWIGFNKAKNFIEDRPDASIIECCDLFIPGTAFNLHFVMENITNMEG